MVDLSIIIPAYNCESTIGRCLDNIIDERYSDKYEIIIINDGSQDKTQQICENYKNKYSNIILTNKKNGGVSSARNTGLDIAVGKYIIFIDSDDYTEKSIIDYIFSRYNQIDDLVLFDYDLVNKNGKHIGSKIEYLSEDYNYIFKEILTQKLNNPFGKIFKSNIIQKYNIRFNTNISLGEDLEFLLKYYVKIKSLKIWNIVLYHYIYNDNSITTKKLSASDINDYCLAYEYEIKTLKNTNNIYILNESYIRVIFRKIFISKNVFYNIRLFKNVYKSNTLINEIFSIKYPKKTNIKKNILKLLIKRGKNEIKDNKYDGLIVTGAPVEKMKFEDVDYWDELTKIFDWANTHVFSSFFICWASQAALYYYHGVEKYELEEKLTGVYQHHTNEKKMKRKILRGFDFQFYAPHSRHTAVRQEDIEKINSLDILATSKDAGVYLVAEKDGSRFFVTGHPEYDPDTLDKEYHRDLAKGDECVMPKNYYKNNDVNDEILVKWRSHAYLLFSNWLNYYVYQSTPYNLDDLEKMKTPQ